MKSEGWPVSKPGRLELEVAHQQQARRADRLHGQRLALGHDQPLLVAQPRGHRRGDEEHDEARVGEQRGHLRPAVAIAIEVRRPGRGLAPDDEPVAAQDPGRRVGVDAREDGPVRERGVVVGVGLDDPDVRRLAPESRQPVDRARDDRQDQHHEPDAEPHRAEHPEQLQLLERIDDARPERAVVDAVEPVHLVAVVGLRAEGEARQLAQRHPDHGHAREHADLDHGEVDRGQEAPGGVRETGREALRRTRGRPPGGDGRDGGSPTRWRPASGSPRGPPRAPARSRPRGPPRPPARRTPGAAPG